MTSVPQFHRRFSLQEQFDDIDASRVRCPVQACNPLRHRVHLQTMPQQKLDDLGSAILASPRKAALHLPGSRSPTSVLLEEGLDQIESSDAGGSFKIKGSPSFGEMLRCCAATVCQAGVNESFTV